MLEQFNIIDAGSRPGDSSNSHSPRRATSACYKPYAQCETALSSPSAASAKCNDSAQVEPDLKPFPTDTFSEEILHLILYHVLTEPDFGKNGKWASREEAKQDKLQFALAHKQRAALHRKFCLIHRSWTPYVLRSLYRSPRLTSRFAIQRLHDCLAHPENLWGVDLDEETGKVIGGPVGDRRYFVRHLGFYTGTGREGSMDWIMYSGEWISAWGTSLVALSPRLYGWDIEGWCSRDCGEGGYQEHNQEALIEAERLLPLTRISMNRVPSGGNLISLVLGAYSTLRILEVLEISRNVFGDTGSREAMYRAFRNCPLEILAIKIAGGNTSEGVLDNVLETVPGIRHLHLSADVISPAFFAQELPPGLNQVLFGCSTRKPVVFEGRTAVAKLWQIAREYAKPNSAYAQVERRRSRDAVSSTEEDCDISLSTELASLHRRFRHPSERPPLQFEHEYLDHIREELCLRAPSIEQRGQAYDWENGFAYDLRDTAGHVPSIDVPSVGLESWLIEETDENGLLRNFTLPDSEVPYVAESLCWRD